MALFNFISKKKAIASFAPLVKAYQQLQLQQRFNSSLGNTIYGYSDQTAQIDAYASIGDLYAIINKIVKTAALIPVYEYKVTNKKQYGKYRIELKRYLKQPNNKKLYELKQMQNDSMELAGEGSPLQDRLDNPNTFQSKSEFYTLTYLFKLLTGNYYIYKDVLNAGANIGNVFQMYNLPPNFTFPIASSDIPRRTTGYKFTLYNNNKQFDKELIIHGKYSNPVFDFSGNELIGLSPLKAGAKTLTTVANETDYANQALKNAGAGGVIVNEDPEHFTSEALGQLKDDVLTELGSAWNGSSNINANKLGFLAGKWNYLKIFIDPANMQLLDQQKMTFKRLCNLYGVSDKLFNNDDGAKYDNYDVALKEMYTNAALPLVSGLCDDFNLGLKKHFDESSIVGYDITDIPELQENQSDIIKKYSDSPAFRVNDLYESLGFGRIDPVNGDKILIKSGYQLLDDVATPEIPLDDLGSNNDYQ